MSRVCFVVSSCLASAAAVVNKSVPKSLSGMLSRPAVSRGLLIFCLQVFGSWVFGAAQILPQPGVRVTELFAAAKAAQTRGDLHSAVIDYKKIVGMRPDLAEAWANLGLVRRSLGDCAGADHDFTTALRDNPQLYVPNLFLGVDLLRQKRPEDAVGYLERAERLNPHDEHAALSLGDAYESLGRHSNASEAFYRAAEIKPRDATAWYALGVSCLNVQKSAVEQLRRLKLTSGYAQDLLAALFLEQGRANDAVKLYKHILASRARPPYTRAALGSAYALSGQPSLAQKTFLEELKTNPGCLPARLGLARIALAMGHISEFFAQVSVAWKADPSFVNRNVETIWNGLSPGQLGVVADWLQEHPGPPSQAGLFRLLTSSIEGWREGSSILASPQNLFRRGTGNYSRSAENGQTSPEDLWHRGHYAACEAELRKANANLQPGRFLLLAQCSFYSGDYRTSFLASASALKANPRSLPALYWGAKSAQQLAAYALARVSVVAPESSKIHFMLAEVYHEGHQIPEAEREYQKAIRLDPDDLSARLSLAKLYYENLELEKEVAELGEVLRQDPRNGEANFLMGEALVKRHESTQAVSYLKTALEAPLSASPLAHSLLAQCFASEGQLSEAIAELKQALPQDHDGTFHYQISRLYREMGKEAEAMAALKQSEMLWKREQERHQAQR